MIPPSASRRENEALTRWRRASAGQRDRKRGAVERVQRALDGHRDARERGGVALRVLRGLRRAQALDEVQERAGVVRLERHDELLVVEPERVGGVEVDLWVLAADLDVLLHDAP